MINVDGAAPVATIRTLPGDAAQNGWWRRLRHVAIRAVDGDRSSGLSVLSYRIEADNLWLPVTGPITLPIGVTTVEVRTRDAAGLERFETLAVPYDPDAPVVKPTGASNPIISPILKLLAPLGIKILPTDTNLQWNVVDPTTNNVKITVIVFSVTGEPVRHIDGGVHATQPGVPLNGATKWDGKDDSLLGKVPVGLYFYRVVATDAAGNSGMSGNSKPITLKIG